MGTRNKDKICRFWWHNPRSLFFWTCYPASNPSKTQVEEETPRSPTIDKMRSADITCIEAPRTKQNRESGGLLVLGQFVTWHEVLVTIVALQHLMQHNALWLSLNFLGTSLVSTEIIGLLGVHHFKPTASSRLTSDVTLWCVQGLSCCYARHRWSGIWSLFHVFPADGIGCWIVKPAGWQLWWISIWAGISDATIMRSDERSWLFLLDLLDASRSWHRKWPENLKHPVV